jgi:hypothetical protein
MRQHLGEKLAVNGQDGSDHQTDWPGLPNHDPFSIWAPTHPDQDKPFVSARCVGRAILCSDQVDACTTPHTRAWGVGRPISADLVGLFFVLFFCAILCFDQVSACTVPHNPARAMGGSISIDLVGLFFFILFLFSVLFFPFLFFFFSLVYLFSFTIFFKMFRFEIFLQILKFV